MRAIILTLLALGACSKADPAKVCSDPDLKPETLNLLSQVVSHAIAAGQYRDPRIKRERVEALARDPNTWQALEIAPLSLSKYDSETGQAVCEFQAKYTTGKRDRDAFARDAAMSYQSGGNSLPRGVVEGIDPQPDSFSVRVSPALQKDRKFVVSISGDYAPVAGFVLWLALERAAVDKDRV